MLLTTPILYRIFLLPILCAIYQQVVFGLIKPPTVYYNLPRNARKPQTLSYYSNRGLLPLFPPEP